MLGIVALLGTIIGIVVCVRIYVMGRKSNNATNQSHAILSGAMILGAGSLLTSYFLLKGEGWTEDNKALFYQLGSVFLMVGFILFGLRMMLSGRKNSSMLTTLMGAGWVIGAGVVGVTSYTIGGTLNDGWSPEKRAKILAKCDPTTTNCQCFVEKTITFFESVDDYTSTLSNESENAERIDAYYATIDTACACGTISEDVEEVDLPF